MQEEQPCRPPNQKQGRGGGAPSAKGEIPLQPKDKIMSNQFVTLKLMEDQSEADILTAGHEEPHAEAGGHILMEAAACEELSQEKVPGRVVTCGEQPIQDQMFWQLWPKGDPCWRSLFPKDCALWKGLLLG